MIMSKKMTACAALVIALFSAPAVYAQKKLEDRRDSTAMRLKREERLHQLITDLQLTNVQGDSIIAINNEFQIRRDSVFINRRLSPEDKMSRYQVLMQAMNQRLKANLGEDLFTRYEAWLNERSPFRKSGKQ